MGEGESKRKRERQRRRSLSSSDDDDSDTQSDSPRRSHSSSSRRRTRRQSSDRESSRQERRGRGRGRSSGRHSSDDDGSNDSDLGSGDWRGSRKKRSDITEEEIVEYMARKAQKKALKVARKLKENAVSGYSNYSNPFGDSNLTEKFVWRKKIERDVAQGAPLDISIKSEKKRQRERMAEIEKVKKRREERAIEKAQHEEEMVMLARERARVEFQDWEKKEEEFHFHQSKVRSQIRLREGRARPIDVLTKTLSGSEEFDVELNEPYMVFKGLSHLDLDSATPMHIKYWEALLVICNWELAEAQKQDALDRAKVHGVEPPPKVLAEERGLSAQ